ncbi:biotin--[acetyl-CoA-carboxylase] ligase [Deinococcus cellulosilyticus]|uniref:Bifunctional ligase/repressor BirA n=1 Tax=Deinococcus cellulosilyticus (strain DSM 18568 / NBRC 106333 / KACC 11606 / 5516J-15) TaxID=1223518 RepID=A0A511N0K3_DEIC1|nr:biotin--[acetyl-CoA-carboxylase] ligase [Deinococcus cellulosilyticus]GEM45967.1 bifunctional ligase/repressor BirA [Deinococcus cellulosilyticus NBRC 106333 = KACC 11606]
MDLLTLLTEQIQSGEAIAERFGVTRVAVWKQIQRLQADGYPVVAEKPKGYRLLPGTPTPAALQKHLKGSFGQEYHYCGTVTSTQDVARKLAESGAPHGTVVLAEKQSQGRGRRGRVWSTPTGSGLYFTIILRPQLSLSELSLLPLMAGVAVREACGVGYLKWPNDLLTEKGKMAGLLLEADVRGEEVHHVLLGIGINVVPEGLPEGAVGLGSYIKKVSRVEVLSRILFQLETWTGMTEMAVLQAWRKYSGTLGRQVRVQTAKGPIEGLAVDVDARGLWIEHEGVRTCITAGDVSLVEPLGSKPQTV